MSFGKVWRRPSKAIRGALSCEWFDHFKGGVAAKDH